MERNGEPAGIHEGLKPNRFPPPCPHLHFQSHCFGISAGAANMPTISTASSDSFSDISDPSLESLAEGDDGEQVGLNGGEVDNQVGEDEKGSDSPENNTEDIGIRLERKTPREALPITKEAYEEQVHLIWSDSGIGEDSSSIYQKYITVDGENMITGDVGKGVQSLPRKTDLQTPGDSSLSSMQTPYRRPRSPGATLDNANKSPAVICSYFANGWCIRGNFCNFLHQKGEFSDTCIRMKEKNLAGTSRKGDSHGAGSGEEAKRMKLSASQEPGDLSNTKCSLKSPLVLPRAPVRACGVENDGQPNFYDNLNKVEADPRSGMESYPSINDFLQKVVQEECRRPFGVSPYFDTLNRKQLAGDNSLSRRYVNEGNPLREMPRGNPLKDSPYTLSSHSSRIDLVPEYGYHSGGLYTESSLDGNSFSYVKNSYDLSYQNEKSHFPPSNSHTSLTSSLNKGDSNLFQPVGYSPLVHSSALAGSVSSRGSVPSSAGSPDTRNTSLIGGENFVSCAASIPKNSSPYYTISEAENVAQHNVAMNLRDFAGTKSTVHDPWAPSVPFRSPFCNAPAKISSYGSQYDPFLDSTEPPKSASVTFRSPESIVHNISTQHMNGDPILSGKISSYGSQCDPLLNSTEPPKSASVTFRSPESIVHDISTQHMNGDPILSGKISSYGSQYDPLLNSTAPPKSARVTFRSPESIVHNISTQHTNGDPIQSGKISSYGSQYDPLLNSTTRPKSARVTFRSPESIVHNISTQHMNGDPILSGNCTQGYNADISVNSFPRAREVVFGKDTLKHGFSGANAAVVPLEEDKHSIPGHVVNDANVNEADPCGNMGSIEDKSRNKESKILKVFRIALVGFVKELVKPSWREGHLSKDAHNMIVKKVVEKVLDTLLPHQIPKTADSVNQYMSASRSKLLKLVEGYVAKYIKSGAI